MSRRILIFSTAYLPLASGAEIAIKEITDRLSGEFEFDLIAARMRKSFPSYEKVGAVNVYRVGVGLALLDKLLSPFWGAIKAWKLARQFHYDCFWAMMVTYTSGAAYLTNAFRTLRSKEKVPIVLTLQEGDSENHLRRRWGGLISYSWRLALARTDFLTAISNYLLRRAERYGYKGRALLIANAVDTKRFSAVHSKKELQALAAKLGKKPDDFFLITTSRLVAKNALDDIIFALTHLSKNIKFLIAGVGYEERTLKKLARKLGLDDRVVFLGFIAHEELPKYLKVSDIFVRPSLSEGFGSSFVEAMASELPVIATPVGGIVDFLFDPERNPEKTPTGLFAHQNDPQSIAKQVNRYMNDRKLREQIVRNAKKMILEKYDWDIIARDMSEKVFEEIFMQSRK